MSADVGKSRPGRRQPSREHYLFLLHVNVSVRSIGATRCVFFFPLFAEWAGRLPRSVSWGEKSKLGRIFGGNKPLKVSWRVLVLHTGAVKWVKTVGEFTLFPIEFLAFYSSEVHRGVFRYISNICSQYCLLNLSHCRWFRRDTCVFDLQCGRRG